MSEAEGCHHCLGLFHRFTYLIIIICIYPVCTLSITKLSYKIYVYKKNEINN